MHSSQIHRAGWPLPGASDLAAYKDLVAGVVRFVHGLASSRSRLRGDFMLVRLAHHHLHDVSRALIGLHDLVYVLREHSTHKNSQHVDAVEELVRIFRAADGASARHLLWAAQELVMHALHLATRPSMDHAVLLHLHGHLAMEFDDRELVRSCLDRFDEVVRETHSPWAEIYTCRALALRGCAEGHHSQEQRSAIDAALAAGSSHGSSLHVGYLAARALLLHALEHEPNDIASAFSTMVEHFRDLAEEFIPIDEVLHHRVADSASSVTTALSAAQLQTLVGWLNEGITTSRPSVEHASERSIWASRTS